MSSVALLLVLLVSAGDAAEKWLDVFTPFPGAERLCSQNVSGVSGHEQRMEIDFTLYTSERSPAEVTKFLAQAHSAPWASGDESVSIRRDGDRKLLQVYAVKASYPDCGVKPGARVRTVIEVAQKTP